VGRASCWSNKKDRQGRASWQLPFVLMLFNNKDFILIILDEYLS
jgi:hypothetical protein